MAGRPSKVRSVPPVHEQMNERAEQEERVRHRPQEMRSVFFPEEECCDGQEQAQTQPQRDAKQLPS